MTGVLNSMTINGWLKTFSLKSYSKYLNRKCHFQQHYFSEKLFAFWKKCHHFI